MSTFNKYRLKGAYHWDWYENEDWYKQCVDECVKFCQGTTLDIGCGEGVLVEKITENGFDAVGIDKDPDAIRLADPELDIRQGDIEKDIFIDRWDYLACLNVIEHLDHPERIKDLVATIKKGAIIITIDWQGGAFGEDHKHEYTYKELLDFFKEFKPQGFKLSDPQWIGVKIKK